MTAPANRTPRFTYPIEKCDVKDREALKAYRKKRCEWLEWLEGDLYNNIMSQLAGMMWNDAAFRMLNEARRFSSRESPTSATAPMLASFIEQGFVATQVLAIARLVDKGKGVVSLRRLLDDIERNAHLITREIYVCHDGLPFDFDAAERAYWEREGYPFSGKTHKAPHEGPDAFSVSCRMHKIFDRIVAEKYGPLARDDRINPTVFTCLRNALEAPEVMRVIQLRHKFVAHAADAASRQKGGIEHFGITMGELENAQRALVQTEHRIRLELLGGGDHDVIPWPQFGPVDQLHLPIVPSGRIEEMQRWWDEHYDAREAWIRPEDQGPAKRMSRSLYQWRQRMGATTRMAEEKAHS